MEVWHMLAAARFRSPTRVVGATLQNAVEEEIELAPSSQSRNRRSDRPEYSPRPDTHRTGKRHRRSRIETPHIHLHIDPFLRAIPVFWLGSRPAAREWCSSGFSFLCGTRARTLECLGVEAPRRLGWRSLDPAIDAGVAG